LIARLAQFAIRRPVLVLVSWALAVSVLAVVGRGVEQKLVPTTLSVPGTESYRWKELMDGHLGEPAAVLLRGPHHEVERQGSRLAGALLRRPHTSALSPWSGGREAKRLRPSRGEAVIVLNLEIPEGENENTIVPPLERFIDRRIDPPVETHLSGLFGRDLNEASVDAVHKGELIAFPALVIVLLLVFRTPIAAAIPLVIALGTVASGFGVIAIITRWQDLDALTLSLASMIGLALGVDYSLLLVSRFREALAQGHLPRQAASIAANTAGRTAAFAGGVLVSITLVTCLASPGRLLFSPAVGAIVVALLSMVGAVLVTPSAVCLLGARINKFQIGGRRGRQGEETIGRFVRTVNRRPLLAAGMVLAGLLLLVAPVLALDTIPPDPRQLPEGSKGLEDYNRVREAGFGPQVEVALRTPEGALTDPEHLREIERFERRLREMPFVKFVTGPGAIAKRARELHDAPKEIRRAKRQLRGHESDLTRLASGVQRATAGVGRLRDGLGRAAGGARTLEAHTRLAGAGTASLNAGAARAADGARGLGDGNARAAGGARQLTGGAARAGRVAGRIAAGGKRLSDGLNDRLAPGAAKLARELRKGQGQLEALSVPTQTATQVVKNVFRAVRRFGVERSGSSMRRGHDCSKERTAGCWWADQRLLEALEQIEAHVLQELETALAAIGGIPLAQYASELGRAADGADRLEQAARDAGEGADRLSDGTGQLAAGLTRLARGNARLEAGLARLAEGAPQLARALGRLRIGTGQLRSGLSRIRAGQARLASGLDSGARRSESLKSRLAGGAGEVGLVRSQLASGAGSESLRGLARLERQSPGLFRSGYLTVAAIDGMPRRQRETTASVLDTDNGGDVGRVVIVPNIPTSDPRTAALVDDVREIARDFGERDGLDIAVGGVAAQLVDYDRVTSARIPLLVIAISLVTYLGLVSILRSLLLPLVAVALNLLTVAAAFGVLTVLFVGADPPLGGAGALDVITVAAIFAIAFALSIDYQVFLLTRMREEFVRTHSNEAAINFGVNRTGGVVTGAAVIMIAVFLAFAMSDFVVVRQFGVGLTVAVLLDATIVRLVLLPAAMRLLGVRIWWMPGWLGARLPSIDAKADLDAEGVRVAA
jgi:putative drug exporter of the RND superfamily